MKLNTITGILAASLLFASSAARAQQQPQSQQPQTQTQPQSQTQQQQPSANSPDSSAVEPLPPLPPDQGGATGNGNATPALRGLFVGSDAQDVSAVPLQADDHVLSGVESFGLGSPTGLHRTFDIFTRVNESVTTGIVANTLQSATTLGGGVTYDQQWDRYRLTALYSGSQIFYEPNSTGLDVAYQEGTLSQEIDWNRWIVRLRDDLIIAPEASFSGLYTGSTGLAGGSVPIPTTAPVLNSPETIQTGLSRSLSNSAIGEVDFSVSPRSSFTATGTYGIIHFLVPGYVDSYRSGGGAGYNYSIDAKNTVSIFYNYIAIGFPNQNNLLVTHVVQGAYGRKITGRLAFQLSAGPELLKFVNYGPSSADHWSWVLSTGLSYQLTQTISVNASYFHEVTPGSGVFLGAQTDVFTGGLGHQFARTWWGSLNGGYARNANLASEPGASNLYNTFFAGASLTHSLARALTLSLNYGLEDQLGAAGACTVATCGLPGGIHHVGSVNLDWRPLAGRFNRAG